MVLSAFHEDATDNHSGTDLPTREAIVSAREQPPESERQTAGLPNLTSHNICNELIEIEGDIARGETYFIAVSRFDHEGRQIDWVLGGRYVDRFERRAASWRIAKRTVIYDWERFDEVRGAPAGLGAGGYLAGALRGVRGPTDRSFQMLSGDEG